MKVCTDSCLFGAWVVNKIKSSGLQANHILDIGTGTGLLSLMLAQETKARIDAVEIDPAASLQARENFLHSPWKDRLRLFNQPVQEYKPVQAYDLVISNPPFFENDLQSEDERKNNAKHSNSLSLEELAKLMKQAIHTGGYCAILLPFYREAYFEQMSMELGLFVAKRLRVQQTVAHPFFRSCLLLSVEKAPLIDTEEIFIHDADRKYGPAFTELLKDYYLYG